MQRSCRPSSDAPIEAVPNIDAELAAKLRGIGVSTFADLRAAGGWKAFKRLAQREPRLLTPRSRHGKASIPLKKLVLRLVAAEKGKPVDELGESSLDRAMAYLDVFLARQDARASGKGLGEVLDEQLETENRRLERLVKRRRR